MKLIIGLHLVIMGIAVGFSPNCRTWAQEQSSEIPSSYIKEADSAMNVLYEARFDQSLHAKALEEVHRLIESGNYEASFRLGRYYHIENVHKNYEKAFDLYQAAVQKKHPWAINNLALLYQEARDYPQAKRFYEEAADLGHFRAFSNLAFLYLNGLGVEADSAIAFSWLQKGMDRKIPEVFTQTGNMFLNGFGGLSPDHSKALDFFLAGAALGSKESEWNAAKIYIEGSHLSGEDVSVDIPKGLKMMQGLADEGFDMALNTMATYHSDGKHGLPVNKEKAIEIWEKAGSKSNCHALANLADAYEKGWGTEPDPVVATRYRISAVACGKPPGGFDLWKLGTRYYYAIGVERDCNKAYELFNQALLSGESRGALDLGGIFYNGCGSIAPDMGQAFKFFLFTAKYGDATAQSNVGAMLKHGQGVAAIDRTKAYAWLRLAQENGSEQAVANLQDFKGMFNKKHREEGEMHLQTIRNMIVGPHGSPFLLADPSY